jgi:hypothetical protein
VLPFLTQKVRIRVWERINPMIYSDDSKLTSGVTGKLRVPDWIDLPGAHALANAE